MTQEEQHDDDDEEEEEEEEDDDDDDDDVGTRSIIIKEQIRVTRLYSPICVRNTMQFWLCTSQMASSVAPIAYDNRVFVVSTTAYLLWGVLYDV